MIRDNMIVPRLSSQFGRLLSDKGVFTDSQQQIESVEIKIWHVNKTQRSFLYHLIPFVDIQSRRT